MDSEKEFSVSSQQCICDYHHFILEVVKNQHGSSKWQTVNTTTKGGETRTCQYRLMAYH